MKLDPDPIRIVSTGDLGLDLLLSGGVRLVRRLPEKVSATLLIRGGPGAGKTLLATQIALALARSLDGDVVVACVEILPTEYAAQLRSARPDVHPSSIAIMPLERTERPESTGPTLFCGLLTQLDPGEPDLVGSLEALERDVRSSGGIPAVFLVDSLGEGYGIGSSIARTSADAVMKFVAQRGGGLVLCEENSAGTDSSWTYAADTVIEIGLEARERGRWIAVRKHRFGASATGRHEVDIRTAGSPQVSPGPQAWASSLGEEAAVRAGWRLAPRLRVPVLRWSDALDLGDGSSEPMQGALALVVCSVEGYSRRLAAGLMPGDSRGGKDYIFEVHPFVLEELSGASEACRTFWLPSKDGPARTLRRLVEDLALGFERRGAEPEQAGVEVRRVLLGDLGSILHAPDGFAWAVAIRALASLIYRTGFGIPVIAHAHSEGDDCPALSMLMDQADLTIRIDPRSRDPRLELGERWESRSRRLRWRNVDDSAGFAGFPCPIP